MHGSKLAMLDFWLRKNSGRYARDVLQKKAGFDFSESLAVWQPLQLPLASLLPSLHSPFF